MKYIDEYRDETVARALLGRIERTAAQTGPAVFMEVCGTHTMAFSRGGLRARLRGIVTLLSGSGCPVCVTPAEVVDAAVAYAARPDVIVATFGDMARVPGSRSSLERARAAGGGVRIVYSPLDAVQLARDNPQRFVIFLGVGFETTAPAVAAAAQRARDEALDNFTVLAAHKLIPPALAALAAHPRLSVHGFLCPGHVSVIIGSRAYAPLVAAHRIPCVIAGFEPLDLLQGVLMLLEQKRDGRAEVETQYARLVRPQGNPRALALLDKVFTPADTRWRGLGMLPNSGLIFSPEFAHYDAAARRPLNLPPAADPPGCRCADVLCGFIVPNQCGLFGKTCTPDAPVGPCMVSSEGACAAYFQYNI